MLHASYNHIPVMAEARGSTAQFIAEVREIVTPHGLEFDTLQILPDTFIRVQIGRIPLNCRKSIVGRMR